ncbi:MAG TPA: RNB domain-containing ribonuclease [Candidatus Saccharimonadales bacterium]
MTEAVGPTVVSLDTLSSEPHKPYGIITADRQGTKEFDDGISVTPLPSAEEMYQVNVFAVDTSPLYFNYDVAQQVINRRETTLTYDNDGKLISRTPMIDPELTRGMHFSEKSGPLGALVVSFTVGINEPIDNCSASYGQVEVAKNYPFNTFGGMCRDREHFIRYGRAAALILMHLHNAGVSDMDIYNALLHVPRDRAADRGLNINRAFMIAANHITGRIMRSEGRPAIYRTNRYADGTRPDPKLVLPAEFSTVPAPHVGMGLDVYTRVTSPLRRAEDFMMHGQLRLRHQRRQPGKRDYRLLTRTIRRLNNAKQHNAELITDETEPVAQIA